MSKLIDKYESSGGDWRMLRDELNLGSDVNLEKDSVL